MFFNPGPSIRANRNGKSAEALRSSTKTKETGHNNPTAFFLSWSPSVSHRPVLDPEPRVGVGRI